MSGKLYVVGTPLGNLGDFSPRAVETLENADFIAAEDTRVTIKLLNHFNVKTPMISYHEHNKEQKNELIINRIKNGEVCALVSDAGMPAISDPGEDLVRLCHENMVKVESVPGPSAVITALALSGMNAGRFCFEGFLSTNKQSRTEHLKSLVDEKRTMIFYEAPHKLYTTLTDFFTFFGDRNISLVKEITKLHENVEKTTISEALEKYKDLSFKGEFVVILEGASKKDEKKMSLEQAVLFAKDLVADGTSPSNAAKEAAKLGEFKKGDIYKILVTEE